MIKTTLALVLAMPIAAAAQQPVTLAISNVNVVDVVSGSVRAGQTVLITGNRISRVGPRASTSVPRGARAIDGSGKFLIPGLWDMHSHVVGFGPTSLPLYLAYGVTSIRDMGAERFAQAKAWRDSIAAGQLIGPRMRIASPVVENQNWLRAVKRMSEQAGTPWQLYERFGPTTTEEVERWVDSVAALGADHIKVRNWPAPNLAAAIVNRARVRGLQVVGHGNEPFPRAGVTTLEHGIWPPVRIAAAARDSMWRSFAASGVAFVPTLVTAPIRNDPPDTLIAKINSGRIAGLQYVPERTRQDWRNQFLGFKQESPMDWATIQQEQMRNVAELHKAGVTLLAGSDIGAPLLVPGISIHDEMRMLVEVAGLTPLEALRAATLDPARVVGLGSSLGSIEEGKLADLVVLDGNPLTDIAHTRRIFAVIANGRLLNRAALDRLLADAERAAR
jgi:imidazolonepropionase-like amidohydrolase